MNNLKKFALMMAILLAGSVAVAGGNCGPGKWYSPKYNKCFKKKGVCKQYNGTDKKTCNTSKDNLRCDWDKHNKTCYPEDGHNQCPQGYWYSDKYNKCFKKKGVCKQYNYTDYYTCNTPKDKLKCDWDAHNETCFPEGNHNQCPKGYWYSDKYDQCFKKKGACKQYNHTDYNTCNSPKDKMRCDWDAHSKTCYPE